MVRGFHFGFEGCGGGLVVLSLRREGTYTVSPSEPRKESPSEPRLPGRSRSRLRSESREPRGARSESRGSSTSLAENDIVSSLENDREKRSPWGNDARIAKMSAVSEPRSSWSSSDARRRSSDRSALAVHGFLTTLTKRTLSRGVEGKEKGASRALRRLRTG